MAPQMFGNAAREHEERFGSDAADVCVKIAAKNHRHSVHNPYSQFNKEYEKEGDEEKRAKFGRVT